MLYHIQCWRQNQTKNQLEELKTALPVMRKFGSVKKSLQVEVGVKKANLINNVTFNLGDQSAKFHIIRLMNNLQRFRWLIHNTVFGVWSKLPRKWKLRRNLRGHFYDGVDITGSE